MVIAEHANVDKVSWVTGQPAEASADPEYGYDAIVAPEIVEGRTIYVARHPDLRHVFSQGETPDEALDALAEVLVEFLRDMEAAGVTVPQRKQYPSVKILDIGARPRPPSFQIHWTVKVPDGA